MITSVIYISCLLLFNIKCEIFNYRKYEISFYRGHIVQCKFHSRGHVIYSDICIKHTSLEPAFACGIARCSVYTD